jgi:hypothetical protein
MLVNAIRGTCFAVVALSISAPASFAASILVFGDRGTERNTVTAELTAQGNTVTNVSDLPTDISGFDTIWHIGAFVPLSTGVQSQLSDFLASGKGVYLTGERPCCDALNNSIESLVNANLKNGTVQIGDLEDIPGPYEFNPSALGNIGSIVADWQPNGPGGIANITGDGVSGDNILVSAAQSGTIVGAGWEDSDFINGGRLVVFMDVNWLTALTTSEKDVIAATQEFLFDGFVGPNPDPDPDTAVIPLPAAGWMLLAGIGGLFAMGRRRKA